MESNFFEKIRQRKRIITSIAALSLIFSTSMAVYAGVPNTSSGNTINNSNKKTDVDPPKNLMVPSAAISSDTITLVWDKPDDVYSYYPTSAVDPSQSTFDFYNSAVDYQVFEKNKFIGTTNGKLSMTVTGLKPDTQYKFNVKTVVKSAAGTIESARSNEITVVTKSAGNMIDVTKAPFNAVGDGVTDDTEALRNAINAAKVNDTVYFPAGKVFLSGALFLHSDMNVRIDGTIKAIPFTPNEGSSLNDHYPLMNSIYEGVEKTAYASLLNLGSIDTSTPESFETKIQNVNIYGTGGIFAGGKVLGDAEKAEGKKTQPPTTPEGVKPLKPKEDRYIRGKAILMLNAKNIYVHGIIIGYGASWTNHVVYSDHVVYDNVKIISSPYYQGKDIKNDAGDVIIPGSWIASKQDNGDGIDPDSSTNVYVTNSYFSAADDTVAIKSGRNLEGYTRNKPSENIRVTDIYSEYSKDGLAVGSEVAAGVHNVLFQNISINNISDEAAVYIKSGANRVGDISNITLKDIKLTNDISFSGDKFGISMYQLVSENNTTLAPSPVYGAFKDITYKNIAITGFDNSLIVRGLPQSNLVEHPTMKNITFDNVAVNNAVIDPKRGDIPDPAFIYAADNVNFINFKRGNIKVDVLDSNVTGLSSSDLFTEETPVLKPIGEDLTTVEMEAITNGIVFGPATPGAYAPALEVPQDNIVANENSCNKIFVVKAIYGSPYTVTFKLPKAIPGTYKLQYRYLKSKDAGLTQIAVNGENVGGVNNYSQVIAGATSLNSNSIITPVLGSVTLTGNNDTITFNSKDGRALSMDALIFTK